MAKHQSRRPICQFHECNKKKHRTILKMTLTKCWKDINYKAEHVNCISCRHLTLIDRHTYNCCTIMRLPPSSMLRLRTITLDKQWLLVGDMKIKLFSQLPVVVKLKWLWLFRKKYNFYNYKTKHFFLFISFYNSNKLTQDVSFHTEFSRWLKISKFMLEFWLIT